MSQTNHSQHGEKNMTFTKWINTFIAEKGIDRESRLEVEGPSGTNSIPVGILIDAMVSAPGHEQAGIKTMVVRIDFVNGDVLHYFTHLAQALAI
jgi:hypothetical protein